MTTIYIVVLNDNISGFHAVLSNGRVQNMYSTNKKYALWCVHGATETMSVT